MPRCSPMQSSSAAGRWCSPWPSKAGLFDYAYDRDSAMFSRDDFEHVLSSIVSAPSASRVHIVAHSMGTMLALESLRQLYARYCSLFTSCCSLAMLAAIRRASSRVIRSAADRRPGSESK